MTSQANETSFSELLGDVRLPGSDATLGTLNAVADSAVSDSDLPIRLPLACRSLWPTLQEAIEQTLARADIQRTVLIDTAVPSFAVQRNTRPLSGIKNLVAVASGKGGVGKSTTAVNLALALQQEGARVGLLDADIYGPSIPRMLGLTGQQPATADGKTMQPLEAFGLQVMSIGFLVDEAAPMVWRGPMVTSALNQLLQQTVWHDLDFLVIDMPPGTGDIQLTLSQSVPVSGAIVVTTPQDVALSDARKGLEMFRKVSVPVLGIVENMSIYRCPTCGEETSLFGQGGGDKLAEATGVPLLGELPLIPEIGITTDAGTPLVASSPDGETARRYRQIAISAGLQLARSKRDYSSAFPNIVVEDS
ncbi:MAG: iron-sulfur cluster carrier protein ApbC [Pseudomonadota bacterium]